MHLTLVTGSFSADHKAPYGTARHGHDWHVEAEVLHGGHKDYVQERLDAILGSLDGGFLDDLLPSPTNEGVAAWIGERLEAADRVTVFRYDAGRKFGGVWRA